MTDRIAITIDKDLLKKINSDCKKENRTLSNMIECMIIKYYELKQNDK